MQYTYNIKLNIMATNHGKFWTRDEEIKLLEEIK